MKKCVLCLGIILSSYFLKAQVNADCVQAIPLCSTPSFTFYSTSGDGLVQDIPPGSNISNPTTNPNPPNAGCLLSGENNPQWLLLTVGNSGVLEFVFGAGNSPNPQAGYYDWAMWPYSPSACANIMNNTLPPIRCNWNATSSGGTGVASTSNIPIGGSSGNYEPPLTVNACQQFIICISNYSNINTLVSFLSLGTASLSCNPNCAPNYSICAGQSVTITAVNFANLTNCSYSIQPGGMTNNTGTFAVTPSVTTSYTTFVTGTNQSNAIQTTTGVSNVTVNPAPSISPTFTQATCSNSVNAVNLNLNFFPPGSVSYTVTWNPVPNPAPNPTQTSVSNLPPGTTNVTVTTANGCSTYAGLVMSPIPTLANFTVSPPGGTYSLTCTNTLIALNAAPTSYSYTWISISNPSLSGTANTFSNPGVYTITATNGIAGCSTQQIITIGQNTLTPTNSVSPLSQVITCNSGSPVTFSGTVSNPTVNIQHDWYSPLNPLPAGVPIATSNNTISVLSGMIPPGIYTLVTTNLTNGCAITKTVEITSLSAWPTFSVSSPTNFSVGCAPLNQTTISIINPVSTQTPSPATCSYTFLAPSFTGVVTPSVPLGGNTSTVTTIPGSWTVIVQDNSNFCRTQLTIPIIQNTVAPNVSASMLTQTLTCYNPTVIATGTTTTPYSEVTWVRPVNPPNVSTATLILGPPNGPNTSSTALTYANYTVVAQNSVNACVSTSVIVVSQNFRAPVSSPTISIGTPTAIYCTAFLTPAILTTGSSTTTSGAGPTAYVANPCWAGPSPQTSTCGLSTYSAFVAGVYSLTIMDNYNGCLSTGTVNVLDRTQPPVLTNPVATSTLDCGSNQALIQFATTGSSVGGLKYLITNYPGGAAFSPSTATQINVNPFLSGTTSPSVMVSSPGTYIYQASNTLTGCRATGTVIVSTGGLTADFEPSVLAGYAPLDVSFVNNSQSSLGSSSIISVWNFGNGTTGTTLNNELTTATYTAPGTYTVMLLTSKGNCLDTIFKTILVDIPSKMEVPNIFTPNGDGTNDIFFLKTANLGEITAFIMDRWGNKVYDVRSSTGNIAWDGKNLSGKECASGVYLYVIKAKGRDGKEYEAKGNITLMR
jgi:gliding motility-associated-like protein